MSVDLETAARMNDFTSRYVVSYGCVAVSNQTGGAVSDQTGGAVIRRQRGRIRSQTKLYRRSFRYP